MSAWIESHSALREHPKLKRLARLLGIERPAAVGYLHYLWWWAMDYAPDGDLSRYTAEDVADALDWPGDSEALIDALRESGFLDGNHLHDWADYGEKLFRRRQYNAARMRAARAAESTDVPPDEPKNDTCTTRAVHVRNTSRATGQTGQTGQTERTKSSRAGARGGVSDNGKAQNPERVAGAFAAFWEAYPRKVDKGHAERAFRAALKKAPLDAIMAGLRRQLPDLARKDAEYIPHAATWLNGERWADVNTVESEDARTRIRNLRRTSGDIAARGLAELERIAWEEVVRAD